MKECLIKLTKDHFKYEGRNAPVFIFFDSASTVVEEKTLERALASIEKHCKTTRGTDFSAPLNSIFDIISTRTIKDMNVMYLTDGEDCNSRATSRAADKLKELLTKKEIVSRFSVLGINKESEVRLVKKILEIGSHEGLCSFVVPSKSNQAVVNALATTL